MADYERYALILDTQQAGLGQVAMRLLELGVDVLYANDIDEAALLARQEQERLGAVLVPASLAVERVETLVTQVCQSLAAGPKALVPVGLELEPDLADALRAHGIEWRIWEPFEDRELRFVLTAAMSTAFESERRKAVRIPTDIEMVVFMGRHRKDVVLHDLSAGGAYFAAPRPFLEGSTLSIEIPLPNGTVVGKAEVVNAKTADKPVRADVPDGMGVVFTQLSGDGAETLLDYISTWIQRFRL